MHAKLENIRYIAIDRITSHAVPVIRPRRSVGMEHAVYIRQEVVVRDVVEAIEFRHDE